MARVLSFAAVCLYLAIVGGGMLASPAHAACPDRPACRGCGCKGGPGYRAPDGRCASFANLAAVCGTPPTTRCTFENAPGTGANRDCALAKPPPQNPPRQPPPRQPARQELVPAPGSDADSEDVE